MHKFVLSKTARLLTIKEFYFVFQKQDFISKKGIIIFSAFNHYTFPRIGLSISKKYIKYAYARNKIKRHMRETFRICQKNLTPKDFVLTISSQHVIHLKNNILIQTLERLWRYHFIN